MKCKKSSYKIKYVYLAYGLTAVLLGACAHVKQADVTVPVGQAITSEQSKASGPLLKPELEVLKLNPAPILSGPSVAMKILVEKGRVEVTSNCEVSVIKAYEDGELRHKRMEASDFKVRTITLPISTAKEIVQTEETFFKDGQMDLHDLAFPEIDEKILFSFTPDAHVLKVAGYPPKSIFYVQAIPLPPGPVKLGQEWVSESSWEANEGVALTTKIKGKFESWKTCGTHQCAEISVSGVVHMPDKLEKASGFEHRITGRFLFEPLRGLIPFSQFVSDERMQGTGAQAAVKSTLRSILIQPPGYYTANHEELNCPSGPMEE